MSEVNLYEGDREDSPPSRHRSVHQRDVYGFALLGFVVLGGYLSYRLIGCDALGWECNTKDLVTHYEDVMAMGAISGVVFATGPLCDSRTLGRGLTVFMATLWCFGAIGQVPWMQNDLSGPSAFEPPALYLYLAAIAIIFAMISYGLAMGCRTRQEAFVTGAVLTAILAVYGVAAIIAFVPGLQPKSGVRSSISFHPHHYALAWNLTFIFRASDDPPTTLIRWLLMGVFVQGMAAYGPAGLLEEQGSTNLIES